jgi:phosphatidylglycerophosphate synthase
MHQQKRGVEMNFKTFKSAARKPHYTNYMAVVFSKGAIFLSYLFAHTPITPNQLTMLSFVVGLAGAVLVQESDYETRLIGVLVWFLSYILDFCDGDVARYKNMKSEFGHWFEAVADRIKDVALFTATTLLAFRETRADWTIVVGLLALGGTVVHSYGSSYGFRSSAPSAGKQERFGNIDYALLATLMVFNYPQLFLVITALTSLGSVTVNAYFAWRNSRDHEADQRSSSQKSLL